MVQESDRAKEFETSQLIRQDAKIFITDRKLKEQSESTRKSARFRYQERTRRTSTWPTSEASRLRRRTLTVLGKTKTSASGTDGVHPLMLINLPDEGKDRLLHLINRSWTESRVHSITLLTVY